MKHFRYNPITSALLACVVMVVAFGCGGGATEPAGPSILLKLNDCDSTDTDPREYSVGTVLVRAFDSEFNPLINTLAIAVEESRATGLFDVSFDVPAGEGMIILVEPRGSGINPDGTRTESGVAMQGVSDPLNIPAAGVAEVEICLEPFIPDSLALEFGNDGEFLVWKKMRDADSHTIRYEEFTTGAETPTVRTIASGPTARVALDDLRTVDDSFLDAFQVASVNDFSQSAFSDTLLLEFIGTGNQ